MSRPGRIRTTACALLLPLAVAATVAADGEEPTATVAIERADVSVDGSTIAVQGETSFTGGLVLTDDTGDASFPGMGFDIESAAISQIDDSTIEFAITVADLDPDTLPVTRMEFPVQSIAGAEIELWAWRTYANALTSDPSADWTFTVATIAPAGFSETAAEGELDGSTFVWRVPLASVGGRPGAWLSGSDEFGDPLLVDPIISSCGAAGGFTCGTQFDDLAQTEPFMIGGSARIVLFRAGGGFVDEAVGKVRRGTFTAVLGDVAPGEYELRIIAEYADVFVEKVVPVTVA